MRRLFEQVADDETQEGERSPADGGGMICDGGRRGGGSQAVKARAKALVGASGGLGGCNRRAVGQSGF
jgi:hypothetical protein